MIQYISPSILLDILEGMFKGMMLMNHCLLLAELLGMLCLQMNSMCGGPSPTTFA